MPEAHFFIREGDTASTLADTLKDYTGAAVPIQNATVRLHMAPITGSGTPALNALATNLDDGTAPNRGKVSYTWAAGNTGFAGLYIGEWEVTFAGGAVQTFPNDGYVLIRVSDAVVI